MKKIICKLSPHIFNIDSHIIVKNSEVDKMHFSQVSFFYAKEISCSLRLARNFVAILYCEENFVAMLTTATSITSVTMLTIVTKT